MEREKFMEKNTDDVCLVEWGSVIRKRSFGDKKIQGDHPAHYGLEARLLFIQQLLLPLTNSLFPLLIDINNSTQKSIVLSRNGHFLM